MADLSVASMAVSTAALMVDQMAVMWAELMALSTVEWMAGQMAD